ncbi:MAG: sugar ABC transporter ATP-binding protein [Spirochaetota bacterium]
MNESGTSPNVLEMRGIRKAFPGVQALDGVSFDLRVGEVHALVGENGAGKSTLMKILSGVYQPDGGEIVLGGTTVSIANPRYAQELGIAIVHQELSLFQNLTVAENIFSGNMPSTGPLGLEDRGKANRIAKEILARFDLPIDPSTPVASLSIGQQQVVEICKALSQKACLVILDEPTSSLTDHETELLFKTIRQLADEKIPVVYISHRLEEISHIADRVTVLRDGQLVGSRIVGEIDLGTIVRMMVGRNLELGSLYGTGEIQREAVLLQVEGLCCAGRFEDVSFDLRSGEILGMAGLVGAGRTDVALAIFGALATTGGTVLFEGKARAIRSPHEAVTAGIAYLPENRGLDGIFHSLSIRENISVTSLDDYARFGILDRRRETKAAQDFVDRLNIQLTGLEKAVSNLSGGNQQKVILGRWLAIHPKLLIVDEPTKGIDIGAKQEIYLLLHKLAQEGVGIIMISSEMPEVLGLSDRILVMHEGRLAGILKHDEASEERVMMLATGQGGARQPV